jgi:hypothetical protein
VEINWYFGTAIELTLMDSNIKDLSVMGLCVRSCGLVTSRASGLIVMCFVAGASRAYGQTHEKQTYACVLCHFLNENCSF